MQPAAGHPTLREHAATVFAGHRIAVVVPARDEEQHLEVVLRTMPPWVDHVIVVDDGSRDATARIARTWGAPVELVIHPRPRGVGAAIATGYRVALASGAGAVAVMAGDAQMRPDELERLVAPVVAGRCDYCKGDRTSHPEVAERMPGWRRLGNAALTAWTRRVRGYASLRDAQCGFTVASARLLLALPLDELVPGYGYPNDLLAMLGGAAARVLEVTVTPVYGDERSGIRPWTAVWTHSRVLSRAWLRSRRAL